MHEGSRSILVGLLAGDLLREAPQPTGDATYGYVQTTFTF